MLKPQKNLSKIFLASIALSFYSTAAFAIDVKAGEEVFKESCSKCHSVAKPLKNKKGPSLLGIMGRTSASLPGYDYSYMMRTVNLTWMPDKMDEFLADPKAVVPNNKMKFKGLKNAEDRANLIEFLQLQQ